MKSLDKFMAAAALALCLDSGAAEAFTPVSTLNFNGGYNATFSNYNIPANANFSDYFIFNLPSYVTGAGASNVIAGISFSSGGIAPTVQLANFALDAVGYLGNVPYVASVIATGALSSLGSYPNAIATLSFGNLAQGASYALNVAGSTANPNGGSYSGNIQFTGTFTTGGIAPLPEPGEWAMLFTGFVFLGFMGRKAQLRG